MGVQQKFLKNNSDSSIGPECRVPNVLKLVPKADPAPLQIVFISVEVLAKRWYQREIEDIKYNCTGDGYVRRNAERGMDSIIAWCGGPRDYNHYCEMMEEASSQGVLPSKFLQDFYDVLYENLNSIIWPRLREMFMKHRENVDSFFSQVDFCEKPT